MKFFEIGKAYTIFDAKASARFGGTVEKRTARTVTFRLNDAGRSWCGCGSVTLRVKDEAAHDGDEQLEYVAGTAKDDRNPRLTRKLYTDTYWERR